MFEFLKRKKQTEPKTHDFKVQGWGHAMNVTPTSEVDISFIGHSRNTLNVDDKMLFRGKIHPELTYVITSVKCFGDPADMYHGTARRIA